MKIQRGLGSPKQREGGFTLVEIVIVLGLFAILMVGLLSLFDWHQKVFVMEQADVRATSAARNTLNNMTRYIAQGYALISSRTINGTDYTTDNDSIVVQVPSVNSSGDVIAATFDYIVFYVNNGTLYQLIEAGAGSDRGAGTKQLAENVYSFALTYNNADITAASEVDIDLETRMATRGSSYVSAHVTDKVFLRNR